MEYELSYRLRKILKKLKRKDPETFKAIKKKIYEIINSENFEHYKPLSHSMKNQRRIHLHKSFVLVFEINSLRNLITFLDYDHHDKVYSKE